MSDPSDVRAVLDGRSAWAIGCCDGFALSAWLGTGAVDHVICDPPYTPAVHRAGAAKTFKRGQGQDIAIDFAPMPPAQSFVPYLLAVSRRWTIAFCALESLGEYAAASGDRWIRSGVWTKAGHMPQITGDRPAQGSEGIAIMHATGRKRWNGGGRSAVWHGPSTRVEGPHVHPTKKPLWLMEALVRDFTDPGDIIMDPCCGEGTTGEAAIRLGRRFIGCEIDPRYHAAAMARVGAAARGMRQTELPGCL